MKKYKIYFRKNIINNISLLLLTTAIGLLSIFNISLLRSIVNEGILGGNISLLNRNIFLFLIFSIVLLLLNTGSQVLKNFTFWKGTTNFVDEVISKVFKADYRKMFLKKDSSMLWTEINMSTSFMGMYFDAIINMIYMLINFLIYFLFLMLIDLYVSIVIIAVITINILIMHKIKSKIQYYQKKIMFNSENLSSKIIECIKLIRNIKAKNKEDYFLNQIDETQNELNKSEIKNSYIHDTSNNLIFFISNITPIIAVMIIIRTSSYNSSIHAGNIIVIYSFIPLILNILQKIHYLALQMLSAKPYLNSLDELLEAETEELGDISISKFETLEVENLEVCLENKISIKVKNFSFKKRDKVLISGSSGCGKSTLFNILTGFIRDYKGSIIVNDINLKKLKLSDLRKIFGITFQENRIFNLPFEESIKLSTNKNINNVLKICELEDIYKHNNYGNLNSNKLSGGEKARINLAQCLIRNPDVLLIDETFSALDEEMETRILKNILKTYPEITIIYISHRKISNEFFNKNFSFSV